MESRRRPFPPLNVCRAECPLVKTAEALLKRTNAMTATVSSATSDLGTGKTPFMFPASFAQRRLWFIDQLEPGTAVYNIPGGVRVQGLLKLDALEKTLNEIIRRHESLRTCFVEVSGELQQAVNEKISLELPVTDLSSWPEETRLAEAVRLAQREARASFDLGCAPLLRVLLLRLAKEDHVLLVTMHHIISDGWSIGIFLREMSELYEAFSTGRPS